jgi:signal peptidase I
MKSKSVYAIVLMTIALAFLLKIILLDVMRVQGASMEPTLKPGVVLFVDRWAFGAQLPFVNHYLIRWGAPRRNDLVVFENPIDGVLVVKRCIGLQGDPISVENNTLTVGKRTVQITEGESRRFEGYSHVPTGAIFAHGDNVKVSEDSRAYGFIPVSHLFGRVMFDLQGDSAGQVSHE